MNTTDGLFTLNEYEIQMPGYNQPIHIVPFGDVHRNAPSCNVEKWLDSLEQMKRLDNAYFLGMGDYDDLMSASEREVFASPKVHESTRKSLDDFADAKTKDLAKELRFMKGKLLGLLGGNHYYLYQTGITSDQKLADKLDCRYLGCSSVIRAQLRMKGVQRSSASSFALDIWAHHGKGAARLVGGSFNRVEQMREAFHCDIYCVDEQTEILSADGWKQIGEIQKGDAVLSFNKADDAIEADVANEVIISRQHGDMYRIQNRNVDMLLSPNHRVLYRGRNRQGIGPWRFKPAADFLRNRHQGQVQVPLAGVGVMPPSVNIPAISNRMAQLAGWILSDGEVVGTSGIRIYQKEGYKADAIRSLLEYLATTEGVDFTEKHRSDGMLIFYIKAKSAKKIKKWLPDKQVQPWMVWLDSVRFEYLWQALLAGDGNKCNDTCGTYYTADEKIADQIQIMLLTHGYRSHKHWKTGGFKDGCWCITWCRHSTTDIAFSRDKITKEHYKGKIWCLSTNNGTVICRRNGKVFITGNCMGHDHKRGAVPVTIMEVRGQGRTLSLHHRKQWLCRTGSFLSAYAPGEAGYIVDRAGAAVDQGYIVLKVVVRRKRTNGVDKRWIDIHAMT